MSNPTWYTPPGDLGIIPEGKFYKLTLIGLDDDNNANPVYFQLIAGALPAGMQLSSTGDINGIPAAVASFQGVPQEVGRNVTSKFTIRLYTMLNGSIDRINDRTFFVTITGQDIPKFTVPSGSLGSFYDGQLVNIKIGSVDLDPNDIVSYYLADGALPNGIKLNSDGTLTGYIIPEAALDVKATAGYDNTNSEFGEFPFDYTTISISKNYQFDIAITDGKDTNVRTYTIYVYSRNTIGADTTDITADNDFVTADQVKYRTPFITNIEGSIGTYRHSNWFAYKFNGIDLDGDIIKYELSLGDGTTFDSDGVGFDATGIAFDSARSELPPGLTIDPLTGWLYGRIPSLHFLEKEYKFAITVSKLKNLDINSINVDWKPDVYAATVNEITLVGEQTIDDTPVITGDRVLVKNQSNPTENGIYIVAVGAWSRSTDMDQTIPLNEFKSAGTLVVNGTENAGTRWIQEYTVPALGVSNIKFNKFVGISETVSSDNYFFTMKIIGEIEKEVYWTTDTRLGTINNGGTSIFYVNAVSRSGIPLRYRLDASTGSRLPQGTLLQSDGTITGKVTFNTFSIDGGTTSFDADHGSRPGTKKTTIDSIFTFTVEAYDISGIVSTFKQFSIEVNRAYNEPYENLYLQALPSIKNRQTLAGILQNEEVIPSRLLYRPMDPNFGRATRVESLFLHGIQPSTLSEYAESMFINFYQRKLWQESIKPARAIDEYGKILYEVVYFTLVDDLISSTGESISKQQLLPFNVTTSNGTTHWIYPNSILNMQNQIANVLPQIAPSELPQWMTSKQSSGNVLGYTPSWVIAFTQPGESEKIAYRIRNTYSNEFNKIYFTVNRLVSDVTPSENFDKHLDSWKEGSLTTFDRNDRPSQMNYVQDVDFATELPYSLLNAKSPAQIFELAGIDGEITDYIGKTIIFLNQEHYEDYGMTTNEGWQNYSSTYDITGYDNDNIDEFTIIPDDGASGAGIQNHRTGIWQFTKINGIYHLELVRDMEPYEYVHIVFGRSHRNNEYFIPNILLPGNTRITWDIILPVQKSETVFDMGGMRFVNPVDMYTTTNNLAKYVPFPRIGILD